MGWLGWPPDVALAADVVAIELALSSRSDLLAMIFGSGEPGKKGKRRKVTAEGFKAFAARVNGRQQGDG